MDSPFCRQVCGSGHHWGFYSYKDSDEAGCLIVDPQPKPQKYICFSAKAPNDHNYKVLFGSAPGFHPEVLERFVKFARSCRR